MERFSIDERSGVPIWVQLRNRLAYLIQTGQYQPGDQLPTVHEMAVHLGINYNTVNKVYRSMETSGLIVSKRGRGTFVAESPAPAEGGSVGSTVDAMMGDFVRQCEELGMTRDEVVARLQDTISRMG
ncbi:GntR family transcriptional regulator [Arabiibacter massiliensis]|uniref:GntR family transcriptional regulator n=1 Tax=Arabiibacter massiliensis TaxID=1870985 RepID=UPI0009BBDA82|nr:GntR family transcriptional regulator [Arabiibacter massiliensis]